MSSPAALSSKNRRRSVAQIVADGDRHLADHHHHHSQQEHQQQQRREQREQQQQIKPKTSIFDLDANLAHLRDTAIDLETRKDVVDPNTDNLRTEELPTQMRRELKEIPEERAHQGHRALHREPLENNHNNNINHHHSSPVHNSYGSPSPLRFDNNNVRDLSPGHNHHAIDRYSRAELSRGVRPEGMTVESFFESPHAIRERNLGDRDIDEVLAEESYRITDARKRAEAAEKLIPESQKKRREINEKCYQDLVNVVGGILNKKTKKKVLRESDSKTIAMLKKQKRALLGTSDDDSSDSDDGAASSSRRYDSGDEDYYASSDYDDDSSAMSDSSLDFDPDTTMSGAEEKARKLRRKNRKRRKQGKRERGRKKHESRLQEILDIVDSVLYDDAGNLTGSSNKAGSGSNDPLSNSFINAEDLFNDDFISTEMDDFFEVTSDFGSSVGDEDSEGRTTPGGTKISNVAHTFRFGKKWKNAKAKKKSQQDKDNTNKVQTSLTEEQEKLERQKQAILRAKVEQERLKKMRAQLQAKRNEQQSQKKAIAKSNWFKKAIHGSPAATANRLGESRNSVHPLRSGTMSPASVRKMLDVEFADDRDGDDDDEYYDEDDEDIKKLEATLLRASQLDDSPSPDRPGTSAAKHGTVDGIHEISSSDGEDSDEERMRAELAAHAANAARSMFNKDTEGSVSGYDEDGNPIMTRRKSMLMMPEEEPEEDEGNIPDDGFEWKIMGNSASLRRNSTSTTAGNNNDNNNKSTNDQPISKPLLEMRQIPNCPQGIYLIQERVSRHEAAAEIFIGNRSSDMQWLMVDYTNVADTMEVQADPIVAQLGDNKHLCCSAPNVKLHIAAVRRRDGNANGEMSLIKQNLEVLPVTTQEALLLKATLNRLSEENKIMSASGLDDIFDSPVDKNLEGSKAARSQFLSIGSDAISRFLQQRTSDEKSKRESSARRKNKDGKASNTATTKAGQQVSFADDSKGKGNKSQIHDAELQAIMNDAIANSSIDANVLLQALNKLRERQEIEAADRSASKTKRGGGKTTSSSGGATSGKNNTGKKRGQSPVDEEVEAATKALLKSVTKIKKEKKEQKEKEKAEKEQRIREEKAREAERKKTQLQLQELEKHKRRLGEDQDYYVGPKIDAEGAAHFLEKNASLIAPGGTSHQKEEDEFHKRTGKGKRRQHGGRRKSSVSMKNSNRDAIDSLLAGKTEEDNNLSESQKLRNKVLLSQLSSDADNNSRPLKRKNSTPFIRAQLTPEQRIEDEKERRRLQEEAEASKRPGTGSSRTSSSAANLLPVPSLSVEEREQLEEKRKAAADLESQRRTSMMSHSVLVQDDDDDALDPLNRTKLATSANNHNSKDPNNNQDDNNNSKIEDDGSSWGSPKLTKGKHHPGKSFNKSGDPGDRIDLDQAASQLNNNNNKSGRGMFGGRGRDDSGNNKSSDYLNDPESSFGKSKSGGFSKSTSGRFNDDGKDSNSFRYSQTAPGFGTSIKGGPSFGKGPVISQSGNAASLRSSIKINNNTNNNNMNSSSLFRNSSKKHESPKNINKDQRDALDISDRQDNNEEVEKSNQEVVPGLTNEEAKMLHDEEKDNLQSKEDQEELKRSIADRVLGPEGSPIRKLMEGNDDNDGNNTAGDNRMGISQLLSDGTMSKKSLDEMAEVLKELEASMSPSSSARRRRRSPPKNGNSNDDDSVPPEDFAQNPLLSDRILTEAFERVLEVAKAAEEKQAEDDEKNRGLGLSVMARDLSRSRSRHTNDTEDENGNLSPSYRSPSTALRELLGDSIFRRAADSKYIPKTRPPVESEDDLKKAHQDRVRASILNAPVLNTEDEDGDNAGNNQNQDSRPNTAQVIHDLVKDHVELTFNLRSELANLARMLRSTKSEKEIAALRKAIVATAWKYQHGREINLRKLIVLLERKTHHRKWLPFIVNENIYADIPGFDDSVLPSSSGRMYGSWKFHRERIVTGSMHTMMTLAATNGVLDVPSIPATASFELGENLIPGSTRMNLSPKPPARTARPKTSSEEEQEAKKAERGLMMNTARARRLSAVNNAREGRGCKFYGVLHLNSEAEERMANHQNNNNTTNNNSSDTSLPAISSSNSNNKVRSNSLTKKAPTLSVASFKRD